MKSVSNRNKFSFDWREMFKRPTAVDNLLLVSVVAAIVVAGSVFLRPLSEESAAQEAALKFAVVVKEAREYARTNHKVVDLAVRPATKSAPSSYSIRDVYSTVTNKSIEGGSSGRGELAIDGDGSPLHSATFVFRKGMHSVRLQVDDKGNISFPK